MEAEPERASRFLLEVPAAALLERRSYAAVHAGAVGGPAGAVVIRGASGAGKSTLVAAAHLAGLHVLGDESILIAREDPDALLAGVREVTLTPASAALLGLTGRTLPTCAPGGAKRRLALPDVPPAARAARRRATILLGPRGPGPARLLPLAPKDFAREFRLGAITQERWSGTPRTLARAWGRRDGYRLEGAGDLDGAVALLTRLVSSNDSLPEGP